MLSSDVFRALADPTRRAVFERLADGELSVGEIKTARREGRFAYYRIDPAGLAPLVDWIDRYRSFWPERIERLRTLLKEMDP
jgi:DNA-binding transcriptional ArsR family regulator